jgi:hypothetical protein
MTLGSNPSFLSCVFISLNVPAQTNKRVQNTEWLEAGLRWDIMMGSQSAWTTIIINFCLFLIMYINYIKHTHTHTHTHAHAHTHIHTHTHAHTHKKGHTCCVCCRSKTQKKGAGVGWQGSLKGRGQSGKVKALVGVLDGCHTSSTFRPCIPKQQYI